MVNLTASEDRRQLLVAQRIVADPWRTGWISQAGWIGRLLLIEIECRDDWQETLIIDEDQADEMDRLDSLLHAVGWSGPIGGRLIGRELRFLHHAWKWLGFSPLQVHTDSRTQHSSPMVCIGGGQDGQIYAGPVAVGHSVGVFSLVPGRPVGGLWEVYRRVDRRHRLYIEDVALVAARKVGS